MLVEDLHDVISVRADFSGGEIVPLVFKRGGKTYTVTRVNGRWVDREGENPSYYFSVQAGGDTYYISLKTADMTWRAESVILDG